MLGNLPTNDEKTRINRNVAPQKDTENSKKIATKSILKLKIRKIKDAGG